MTAMIAPTAHFTKAPMPTNTQAMTVTTTKRGPLCIVTVQGDVDLATAPQLAAAITTARRREPTGLIIDLTSVDFLACAGIAVLCDIHRHESPDTHLAVVARHAAVTRPLHLLHINDVLDLYPTLGHAVQAFDELGVTTG